MEENTQLPKEVVDTIQMEAEEVYNKLDELAGEACHVEFGLPMFHKVKHPIEDVLTAYATKLHQANETIKALEYDNNRLKGEVEGLQEAVEELRTISPDLEREAKEHAKTIANNSEHQLYVAQGYYNAMLIRNVRESAAGREEDLK